MAVVALVLLSGCSSPEGEPDAAAAPSPATWSPLPCDPGNGTHISADAPLVGAFQGDLEDVARRIAGALDRDLPPMNVTRSDGGITAWHDPDMHIEHHEQEHADVWRVNQPEAWPSAGAGGVEQLRTFFSVMGVPAHVQLDIEWTVGSFDLAQHLDGESLPSTQGSAVPGDGSGRMGWWSGLSFRSFHDLRYAHTGEFERQARDTASAFVRCHLDSQEKTEEQGYLIEEIHEHGRDVRHGTMVWQVAVYHSVPFEHHCGGGGIVVAVDAGTGRVVDHQPVLCD